MKRWLVVGWLSLSLSVVVCAQSRTRRFFVGIDGPVKTVRWEVATLNKSGESIAEGPKVMTVIDEVGEDRMMTVSRRYQPDGTVSYKQVTYYQADGRAKESLVYSGEHRLTTRMLYYYGEGGNRMELLNYGPNEILITKEVQNFGAGLSLVAGEARDKDGNLSARELTSWDSAGRRVQTRTSYRDGQVSAKSVMVTLSPREYEQQFYDADGVLTSKMVTTQDHKGEAVEWATYDGQGNLRKKDSYRREYDSHGNWVKQEVSKWNPQTGMSEPVQVMYRVITYYDN